jgi:hypothetical protein
MATDLQDIKGAVRDDEESWKEARDEGDKDMLCVSGDVWGAMDPVGKRDRDAKNRPCISFDELSQYTNQAINDLRGNKRAIVVSPVGAGANAQTAEYRQNRIRQIEYRSNAQQAYLGMYADAIQRGYGFLRIIAQYVDDSDDQELLIRPCYNPNLVTPDANSIRPDGADMKRCTIREVWRWSDFARRFPRAERRSFTEGMTEEAPSWVTKDTLTLAEHWVIETTARKRLTVMAPGAEQPEYQWDDELKKGQKPKGEVRRTRDIETSKVKQYLTNGLEILDTVDWPGKWVPVVSCFGKVLYINDGGKTRRILMSMVRLAREPEIGRAHV